MPNPPHFVDGSLTVSGAHLVGEDNTNTPSQTVAPSVSTWVVETPANSSAQWIAG